jgi:DeoR family glycerol-3-phosphate regulon repressor
MVASGTIRQTDGGIIGPSTEDFVDRFKLDYAVIGCSAVDDSGEIFDYDLREVRVTQCIIRHARCVILVTDSMKFQRNAPVRIGTLRDIDILVTDDGVSNHLVELCRRHDTTLKIAHTADHNNKVLGLDNK